MSNQRTLVNNNNDMIIYSYPNQKLLVNGEIRAKLRARTSAFKSGDPETYKGTRYDLRNAKRNFRDKVESSYQIIKQETNVQSTAALLDELDTFYACFNAANKPVICLRMSYTDPGDS